MSGRSLNAELIARLENTAHWEARARDAGSELAVVRKELSRATVDASKGQGELMAELERLRGFSNVQSKRLEAAQIELERLREELLDARTKLGGPDAEVLMRAMAAQQKMIRILGMYLSNVAGRVKSDDPLTKRLMPLMVTLGDALNDGDVASAMSEVAEVIALGGEAGLLPNDVVEDSTPFRKSSGSEKPKS